MKQLGYCKCKRENHPEKGWVYGQYFYNPSFEHSERVFANDSYILATDICFSTLSADKNGTEIFEHDIVRADNGHESEVILDAPQFRLVCKCHPNAYNVLDGAVNKLLTVIGNTRD